MTDRQQKMLGLRDRIVEVWIDQLRAHISQTRKLPKPLLMDTLPTFYETLVDIGSSNTQAYERSTLAVEHGGERARLTHYDTQSLVKEYQLFRRVVFSEWDENGIKLSIAESAAVNSAIDQAVAESISGFVMVEDRFREQFFSALAHDMRTPLATASMAVGMIRHADSFDRIRTMAEIATKQHNLLSQMITDLLDTVVAVSGTDISPQFKPVDIHALALDVARSAQLVHGRSVIVQGDVIEGFWSPGAIRRALENLVNNAIKYGAANTDVTITLHHVDGRCTVEVENSGSPIPVEQQENIFQLFRRNEQARQNTVEGWGIGLPYVRSVAEQHGGSISVKCTDTKTTFFFDIPLDPRPILQAKNA